MEAYSEPAFSPEDVAAMNATSEASFAFLRASELYQTEKPYYFNGDLPAGQEQLRSNLQYESIASIRLTNVRGFEDSFSLESHGFRILKLHPKVDMSGPSWDTLPIEEYLKEIASLVKTTLNAQVVLAYNYKVPSPVIFAQPSDSKSFARTTVMIKSRMPMAKI